MVSKTEQAALCVEGKRIYLRKVLPEDVGDAYIRWMNDEDVVQFTESRFCQHSKEELISYVERVGNDGRCAFFAIIVKEGNKHIGNIKMGPINKEHRFADVGIIIGEKSYWGKGFAAEAIKLIVNYAFDKLNLHKLTAGCYANNIGAIKAFKKAKFTEEGRLKKHYLSKGEYVDKVCLGIINPNFSNRVSALGGK